MENLGLTGLIAAAVTEVINRGLGISGRKAFLCFLFVVMALLALKVGSDLSPLLAHLWQWAQDVASAILAGTGAHKLMMSRSATMEGDRDGTGTTR